MKIEETDKQTPQALPSSGRSSTGSSPLSVEQKRFVWEELVPRLLHPSKLAFIHALLEASQPLTLEELAEVAKVTEKHAEYQCNSMQKAGVLEVVPVPPREGEKEEFTYFFPASWPADPPRSR
jgi:hypothetical protein